MENKYLIGLDNNDKPIITNNLKENILFLGTSGSGKIMGLFNLFEQQIKKNKGSIIIDGMNDNYMFEDFLKLTNKNNKDVLVLNFNLNKETNTFNPFHSMSLNMCEKMMKEILFNNLKDKLLKSKLKKYISNVFGVLEYIENKTNKKSKLEDFINLMDLKNLMVNLIPASKEDKNKPDKELLKLNLLLGYEEYWIPKDYTYKGVKIGQEIEKYLLSIDIKLITKENNKTIISNEIFLLEDYEPILEEMSNLKEVVNLYSNIFCSQKSDIDLNEVVNSNKIIYCILPVLSLTKKQIEIISKIIIYTIKNLKKENDLLLFLNEPNNFINKINYKDLKYILKDERIGTIISAQDVVGLNKKTKRRRKILKKISTKFILRIGETFDKKIIKTKKEISFLKNVRNGKGIIKTKGKKLFVYTKLPYIEIN